jgi:hypothetical protein
MVFPGQARRTGNRPVEAAVLHDSLHGQGITHMISKDKPDNSIGNPREMRTG